MSEIIVQDFIKNENEGRDICSADAVRSSKLAVAMEQLGMLDEDPEMKSYASNRGGFLYHWIDTESFSQKSLSLRELLEMLPD